MVQQATEAGHPDREGRRGQLSWDLVVEDHAGPLIGWSYTQLPLQTLYIFLLSHTSMNSKYRLVEVWSCALLL